LELAQCTKTVYAEQEGFVTDRSRRLFIIGNVYPLFRKNHCWYAADEEGEQHVVADMGNKPEKDDWFSEHFHSL